MPHNNDVGQHSESTFYIFHHQYQFTDFIYIFIFLGVYLQA